jgi:hypothetical protein
MTRSWFPGTLLGELARRLKPDTGRAPENRNAAVGDE